MELDDKDKEIQELKELLKDSVKFINLIPNKKLIGKYKDSYSLASEIDRIIKK